MVLMASAELEHKINILVDRFDFKFLDVDDIDIFKNYQYDIRISDLDFSTLFCWKNLNKHVYKIVNGYICMPYVDMNSHISFYPLMGKYQNNSFKRTVDYVIGICESIGINPRFDYVEEWQMEYYTNYKTPKFYGFNDDFSDYIYKTTDFTQIDKNKRSQLNSLSNKYNITYSKIDDDNKKDCLGILDNWCRAHPCSDCVFGCEAIAINDALENYKILGLSGGILYLNDVPSSFIIASSKDSEYILYLFQKNSVRAKGLTIHLYNRFAQEHSTNSYINFSEDMGLEGLRSYKQKLCSYDKLNKYYVIY